MYSVTPQQAWLNSTGSLSQLSEGVDNKGATWESEKSLQRPLEESAPSRESNSRRGSSASRKSLKGRASSLPSLTLQDLEKTNTSVDSQAPPTSPLSEGGSSIWEHESDIVTVLIDPSSGKSIQQRRRKSLKSIKSRDSSRESICESEGTSSSSKSKKKKRNRLVDIDDIVLDFDPEKEFLWEMWKKYEREKLKKQSAEDLHSLSGDEGYHTRHRTNSSEINISGAKVKTSEFSLHKSVNKLKSNHSRKSSNASNMSYTSGEEISTPEERTVTPDPTQVPNETTQSTSINFAEQEQFPQPIEVDAVVIEQPQDNVSTLASSINETPSTTPLETQGDTDQKAKNNNNNSKRSQFGADLYSVVEVLVLHRLPGEKLGMGLSVESTGGESDPVKGVFVESVTPGGAADRASGGKHGLCVGDEILEVNNSKLSEVSYSETVAFFKEMPLRVMFTVRRQHQADLEVPPENIVNLSGEFPQSDLDEEHMSSIAEVPNNTTTSATIPGGFELVVVTVKKKDPKENLGLTIVPSYGSTSHFYQVRITIVDLFSNERTRYILVILSRVFTEGTYL